MKVSYHPAKFVFPSLSDGEDLVVCVCHVISQDIVIKEPCGFIGRRPLR